MKYLHIVLLSIFCLCADVAEALSIKSVIQLKTDISARTNLRVDAKNNPCALVRVDVPTLDDVKFGNMAVGDVKHLPGEYVVYLSPDTQILSFYIKDKKYDLNFSDFDVIIEGKNTYRVILSESVQQGIATAVINANYDDMTVLIDGIPMGQTPLFVEAILPGHHTIAIPNTAGVTMNDTIVEFVKGNDNYINLTLYESILEPVNVEFVQTGGDTSGWYHRFGINIIEKDGKYGVEDYAGEIVVPYSFDYISPETLACNSYVVGVRKDDNSVSEGIYVPNKGLVVPCIYDRVYVYGFKEGLARVEKNNKYGIVDLKGNTILPTQFNQIKISREDGSTDGLGFITQTNNSDDAGYRVYDMNGNHILGMNGIKINTWNENYGTVDNAKAIVDYQKNVKTIPDGYRIKDLGVYVSDGLLRVTNKSTNQYGFVDTEMNLVIPAIYDDADEHFTNRFCKASRNGKEIIIDEFGNEVFDCQKLGLEGFDYIYDSNFQRLFGYLMVTDVNNNKGVYNYEGKPIIPCRDYESINVLQDKIDNTVYITTKIDGVTKVMNQYGELMFELPENTYVPSINGGIFEVLYDSNPEAEDETPYYGYVDSQGSILANCIYRIRNEESSDYEYAIDEKKISEGLAVLCLGNRYGFIDKTGKVVIPLVYTAVTPFENGVAYLRDQKGVWNKVFSESLY